MSKNSFITIRVNNDIKNFIKEQNINITEIFFNELMVQGVDISVSDGRREKTSNVFKNFFNSFDDETILNKNIFNAYKLIFHDKKLYNEKSHIGKYFEKRLKNDKNFRLSILLRNRINQALRYKSSYKRQKWCGTKELLGLDFNETKKYIESLFLPGMSWENWGRKGWVIDHIIPICSVNLENKEEQLKVFNYKNMRPIWNIDNIRKIQEDKKMSVYS